MSTQPLLQVKRFLDSSSLRAPRSPRTPVSVAAAEKQRASDGKPHGGGNRSYGYRWDKEAKKLIVVPDEAKVIKKIVKKLTAGASLREVAKWLNSEDHTTTTGRRWTHQSVKQMISSPKLRGERIYHGETIPSDLWKPILKAEEQFAALDRADHGSGFRSSPNRMKNRYLLSGLIYCSQCDGRMYPAHGKQGKTSGMSADRNRTSSSALAALS